MSSSGSSEPSDINLELPSPPSPFNYAITHVFFPVQLPGSNDYTPENDFWLAGKVLAAANSHTEHVSEPFKPHWHRIIIMLHNLQAFVQSEGLEKDCIITKLQGMQVGDILTFLIRPQNAAVVLTKQEENILCESFEVPPKKDAVEATGGSLIYSYPRSAVSVRREVSDEMGFQYELASFLCRPDAILVNSDLPSPSPGDPLYITALLPGILRGVGHTIDVPRISKRIRDNFPRDYQRFKNHWRRSPLWLLIRVTIQMSLERSLGRASYKEFMLSFISTLAMHPDLDTLSNDLLYLMECKILRRLSKLGSSTPSWLSDMALKACARLRQILDARWEQPGASPPFRNPSQEELARDGRVSLLNSDNHIRNALSNPGYKSVGIPFNPNHRRRGTIDDFLSLDGSFFEEAYRVDPDVTLFDVERAMEHGIDDWVGRVTNVGEACTRLEILMDKYLSAGLKGDDHHECSEHNSIKLLTGIEFFLAVDKLVIREIPLLADYSPEIPIIFLEGLFLRTTTNLHRLSNAYKHLSTRHFFSSSESSVVLEEFTEHSFPVRYYDQSPHLCDLRARIEEDTMHRATREKDQQDVNHLWSPLPMSPLQAKVVIFELQCPASIRIWRSAAFRLLNWFFKFTRWYTEYRPCTLEVQEDLLAHSPELRPYFSGNDQSSLDCQIHFSYVHPRHSLSRNSSVLRYVLQRNSSSKKGHQEFVVLKPGEDLLFLDWELDNQKLRSILSNVPLTFMGNKFVEFIHTEHTPNDVLAAQVCCPKDFSLEEFTVFAQLRSCGSLQWLNILHSLRSRTLNLRRPQVHCLLFHVVFQVGPLNLHTGEWIWHQELENVSFCNALIDELYSLSVDFGARSMDAIVMGSISLLLTRILASSPSTCVSERVIQFLRNIRSKTFSWVEEMSYNLAMAPTNPKRSRLLVDMAAICRGTFDIDPSYHPEVFRSAEDVDAAVSCALFIRSLLSPLPAPFKESLDWDDVYSKLLFERYRPLSWALEGVLSDVILADPSEYGVDLAVHKLLGRYQPCANRWEQLQHPDDRWLSCKTELPLDQPSKAVHFDLLTGTLLVNGNPLTGLPFEMRDTPECKEIFRDGFISIPSDLPEMDFMTHTTSSERRVHYSLRDDDLVVQVQSNGTRDILQLLPSKIFLEDLPITLVNNHVHWLNLASRIIEIRPLERLWEESSENWRIDCTIDQYRIYRGNDILVDTRSPTWAMISRCFEPLTDHMGMLITMSPTDSLQLRPELQLSVVLPRYGLSFFVNAQGELESLDFKNMVYDDNQSIGTLFGLDNLLVLRPKLVVSGTLFPEALIPRRVLVPDGLPIRYDTHRARVEHYPFHVPDPAGLFCHVYDVDTELGCLMGDGSLKNTQYLAILHAATSCDTRPDPLTSKTGAQTAHGLLRLGGCRSVMKLRDLDSYGKRVLFDQYKDEERYSTISVRYPQFVIAHTEIQQRYYWHCGQSQSPVHPSSKRSMRQAVHLFPSNVTDLEDWDNAEYSEIDTDLELQDVVSTTAFTVYSWSVNAPTITPLLNWQESWLWHLQTNPAGPDSGVHSDPGLVRRVMTKVHSILEKSEELEACQRFQLLFLLPTTAYCSPCYPAGALLLMLMAFAKISAISPGDLLVHTDHELLDGWRPTEQTIRACIFDSVTGVFGYDPNFIFVATMDLLKGWPCNTPPLATVSRLAMMLPNCSEERLEANLQQVFSSCSRNFVFMENLTRIVAESSESEPGRILQVAPLPVTSTSHGRTRWQVTLEKLLADRPVPILPTRSPLLPVHDDHWYEPGSGKRLAEDTLKLERRVFSFAPTDHSFQQEYLTYLHASSKCVRDEYLVTHPGVVGVDFTESLRSYYIECRANYMQGLAILKQALASPTDPLAQAINESGQWPQVGAFDLLQYLAPASQTRVPAHWKKCLVSFALLLLDLQRSRRLLRFALYGLEEELSKELTNAPCDGWNPEDYPDWLLIQIQGNFSIRRAQVEAAMELMSPQSGENTVMQVNMGEGKSSVIIPITAAALADGKRLVRVVVPQALTVQMFDVLVSHLGGLANRPIYHLPFSRNPEYGKYNEVVSLHTHDLQELMSQCMAERGILLLQPEHVVSLGLMSLEAQIHEQKLVAEQVPKDQKWIYKRYLSPKSLTEGTFVSNLFRWLNQPQDRSMDDVSDTLERDCGNQDTASKWFKLQKWVFAHCRDILDESDEILHPRFQLIYTIGAQQHMDGCPHRWTIIQQVLRLVKEHAYSLWMYSPQAVEYKSGPQSSFPYIRIVRASDVGRSLASFIAEDVMAGEIPGFDFRHVPPHLHDAIHSFISHDVLQLPDIAERVEEFARNSHHSYLWSGLLLLRGLLASDILVFALSEWRWRVNYGLQINPTRSDGNRPEGSTMLAVPYRAKDTPAPNTQFGHPDIAIILTCLSYYYTGLTEDQLRASFEILLDEDDPSAEYIRWVKDYDDSLPKSLQALGEINLRSSEQWDKVTSPLFTRNQATIDFYLSRVVFPKEAKEFPWKLSGSSWDLAEKRENLTTGFSGTNDNRWLLPTSIAQYDLEGQKGTNARVLGYLLRPENDCYEVTYDSESGKRHSTREFLKMVANQEPEIRVLLDVGAQILDLSNEEVARAWLYTTQNISGAVYFNQNNELMVLTPKGTALPLLSSPLSQTLERCVVYLDHAHTRGTNLKFPNKSRAAVTLGPKITKDDLVQGCMRMRKLGHGHSVMFFAPLDVDQSIRAMAEKQDPTTQVTALDILFWAIHGTWTEIKQGAPHWAQQGMSHKLRYESWARFSDGGLTREELSKAWLQPERKSLIELYGSSSDENSRTFSTLDPGIRQRCEALGVLSLPSAQLEEQQEREVNREREREREVELPPEAESVEHSIHPDVEVFVKTGIIPPLHSGSTFQPVFTLLKESTAATQDADVWSPFILATTDFCRTIKPESTRGTMDQYLRPVQWILTSESADTRVLVLLSPFEVHELLPDIRVSERVHLHLYAPRTSWRMQPSDDLKLYTIPPLPNTWTPPWNLIDQLNVFAGQLYLRDYQSYLRLCRFLGVLTKDSPNDITTRWNLFNIPGSFQETEIMFSESPLPTVMALLGIRTRGRPFAHTHMGRILQGHVLGEKDFKFKDFVSDEDASNDLNVGPEPPRRYPHAH